MLDLVHLRSFAEVTQRGTVAAAAAATGYTAPAVSQHIAKLEAEVGVPLFDRLNGRLRRTAAGDALVPVALEMLDLAERGRRLVTDRTRPPHVVVAGFASAIATVVVPRLAALRQVASIEIREAEDAEALRDLGLGAVDVVLTQEYDGAPIERNRRFAYTPLVSDRLTLVMPPDRPASTRLDELGDVPWLLNGRGTRCAEATTRVLAAAGLRPDIVADVGDNATLLALVAAGHGVTVVPALVLGAVDDSITVGTQELGVGRTIHAVTRGATGDVIAPLLALLADP
jgi:DNA-binding transcriptional LysR family regulator